MEKRVVIAGCRGYTDYEEAKVFIAHCTERLQTNTTFVLISGACQSADRLGERFAIENGWRIELFPADWERYGRAAGPIRNRKMIDACDYVICFWDGKSRGTYSLIQYAKEVGRPLAIKRINTQKQSSSVSTV